MEQKKYVIGNIIAIVLIMMVLSLFGGWYLRYKNEPECYINYDNKCIGGYSEVWEGRRFEQARFIECCKSPHYLLQGYFEELSKDFIRVCNDEFAKENFLNITLGEGE